MFCKFCGAEIDDDCVVCPACGKQVGVLKSEASGNAGNSSNGGTGTVVEGKNKLVAGILGILVGGIGIHDFYLGYTTAGILSILFCWTGIPAIIGLIQGIIILTETGDAFAQRVYNARK